MLYDSLKYAAFRRLYTWTDAMRACPEGWHLPSDAEWKELEKHLGLPANELDNTGYRGTDQCKQLKEGGTSGFNALMTGMIYNNKKFSYSKSFTYLWTSTEYNDGNAWCRFLDKFSEAVHRQNIEKDMGLSVRCIKDN